MITFEDVTKFYPGQERAALRNVNLEIEKGE
ncbi:MAG TPA: cell division ATP-binding protein FtsE, partial [Arachnia sp.]|nr:cell division ATP-binding protein FtsE [Arachnia sp.]